MSRLEDIDTGIWGDPPFEDLSAPAGWLYIWSWTNPRCGMSGLYKVSRRGMTASKVDLEQIDDALEELATARFAYYQDDVLFIRARVKRLRQKTTQIAKAIANDVKKIAPEHPLREMFLVEYGSLPWLNATLAETLGSVEQGSSDPQPFGSSLAFPGPSVEPQPRLLGKGNGKGKGTGNGKGNFSQDARGLSGDDMRNWVRTNLADLPESQVMSSLVVLQCRRGGALTADVVRSHVEAKAAA